MISKKISKKFDTGNTKSIEYIQRIYGSSTI